MQLNRAPSTLARRRVVAGLLAGSLAIGSAWAQPAAPTRIRGKIAAVDAHSLTIKTRNGATEKVTLDEPLSVSTVRKVALGSIADGRYVGTAARRTADGSLEALEVVVFPEAMRGAGEGHRPWDLGSDSTMTNGTVNGVVKGKAGRELTITYKDGSQTVRVLPKVPVVTLASANRSDLKVGAPVFLSATRSETGTWHTGRVTVGTHGVAPPM